MGPSLSQLLSLTYHGQQMAELLSYEFMRAALVGSLLIALVAGYFAVFVVLRRIVFVSVALAECSALGVALGLMRGVAHASLTHLSLIAGLFGVGLVSLAGRSRRVTQEAVVGLIYGAAAALSITLLAAGGMHEGHELKALLWGDVLALSPADVGTLAIALLAVMAIYALTYKELLVTGFDPEMARSLGYAVGAWDMLFFALLGVAIAFSVRLLGLLVVFSYLVMPGVAGLCLGRSLRAALLWAVGLSVLSALIGVYASWLWDLPTGPTNVVALAGITALAALAGALRRR